MFKSVVGYRYLFIYTRQHSVLQKCTLVKNSDRKRRLYLVITVYNDPKTVVKPVILAINNMFNIAKSADFQYKILVECRRFCYSSPVELFCNQFSFETVLNLSTHKLKERKAEIVERFPRVGLSWFSD